MIREMSPELEFKIEMVIIRLILGKVTQEMGQVIIATGGFGADFTDNSYLK